MIHEPLIYWLPPWDLAVMIPMPSYPRVTLLDQRHDGLNDQHLVLSIDKLHRKRFYGVTLCCKANIDRLAAGFISIEEEGVEMQLELQVGRPSPFLSIFCFLWEIETPGRQVKLLRCHRHWLENGLDMAFHQLFDTCHVEGVGHGLGYGHSTRTIWSKKDTHHCEHVICT